MSRLLLVVDPQIDFINGTLPVPGAQEAMDALAEYVKKNSGRYVQKIITADRHPYGHSSFIPNGGIWPPHCVHDTIGAAVWPALFDALYSTDGPCTVFHKGEKRNVEEYSVFSDADNRERIMELLWERGITEIDICGLAGDVCVKATAEDVRKLFPGISVSILSRYSPCINKD